MARWSELREKYSSSECKELSNIRRLTIVHRLSKYVKYYIIIIHQGFGGTTEN
jgi:hypothetical protein